MNLFISTKRITNKKISINIIKFNFDFIFLNQLNLFII